MLELYNAQTKRKGIFFICGRVSVSQPRTIYQSLRSLFLLILEHCCEIATWICRIFGRMIDLTLRAAAGILLPFVGSTGASRIFTGNWRPWYRVSWTMD